MRTANLSAQLRAEFSALFFLDHVLGRPRADRLLGGRRRRLKERMAAELAPQGAGATLPVERVGDLSPAEFFARYGDPGTPVVFTDVAKRWKAVKEWSFEFFRDRYGDDDILLVNHKFYAEEHRPEPYERMTLRDFIDHVVAGGRKYMRFNPLIDRHPELLQDMDQAWLSSHMYKKTSDAFTYHNMFIGNAGTKTPTHCAGTDNFFLEVAGTKRWYVWPSTYTYLFDPEANRMPGKSSAIDPRAPDLERFPAYAHVDTWVVDLEPGEILYLPPFVWHHVENLTPTIGVGTRWFALSNNFRRSPLLTTMEFLNTNPSLPAVIASNLRKGVVDFNEIILMSMGLDERPNEERARKPQGAAASEAASQAHP